MIDGDDCGAVSGMNSSKETRILGGKSAPNAALSTTDPILFDLASNLGRHIGKSATNGLSFGTAREVYIIVELALTLVDSRYVVLQMVSEDVRDFSGTSYS
jgi:hypothetical protein